MKSSNAEKKVGIETFFTKTKGIGGRLRTISEDFIVKEIFQYPPKTEDELFTIAEVTAKNWETNHLVRELSKRLQISRKRIGFAGTKDKRSCSTQLMSFYQVSREKLSQVLIKDVDIDNIYSSNRPVNIGDLVGNRFEITVRNIKKDVKSKHIKELTAPLLEIKGFPNFYGIQRFGVMRPITHVVGKHIVQGDFEAAVMSYIANPIDGETEETYNLRKRLQETYGFHEALKSYPDYLSFEKAMLNKLVVNPKDFVGALKELPKNLLTMFVYAYQSYLFNRMLSKRIERKLPLHGALVGDVILPVKKQIIDEKGITVTEKNIEKVNNQIAKNKAFVSSLLIGSDSDFSNGEMGEIEKSIVEQESIDKRDFIIPEIPFLSSSGSRRSLLAPLKTIDWKLIKDKFHNGQALTLKFELQKGCYATSLLREFMKSKDIKNY